MPNYNTKLKKRSLTKIAINKFLKQLSTPQTNAIVIDAETFLSSSALVSGGVDPRNIVVINNNDSIIKNAHKKGHTKSIVGISTTVFMEFLPTSPLYDIIYLDFCGIPDTRGDGWCPQYDILWCATFLKKGGTMVVTFSKRISNCAEKIEKMIPYHLLTEVKHRDYCETSPMIFYILTNDDDTNHVNHLRHKFNHIYTTYTEELKAATTLSLLNKKITSDKNNSNSNSSISLKRSFTSTIKNKLNKFEKIKNILEKKNGAVPLSDIYKETDISKASVRQVLQKYSHNSKYYGTKYPNIFTNISKGYWQLTSQVKSRKPIYTVIV